MLLTVLLLALAAVLVLVWWLWVRLHPGYTWRGDPVYTQKSLDSPHLDQHNNGMLNKDQE